MMLAEWHSRVASQRGIIVAALLLGMWCGLTADSPSARSQRKTGHSAAQAETQRAAAVITARLEGRARPFSPDFLGYNGAATFRELGWGDPDLIRALVRLKPPTLRHPGGTAANYWDWSTGYFVSGVELPGNYAGFPRLPNRLEDFKRAIDACGAQPILVLNLLTSTLDEQLEMLRQARRIGLPVKYLELGNEFYLGLPDYRKKFPTAADYGREASRWSAAIHQEFPGARVAAVAASARGPNGPGQERRQGWNKGLMETLQGVDALVIHMYAGAGLPAADSPAQTGDADDTDDVAGNNNRTGKRQANRSPNSPANKPEARPLAPASVAIALGQPFQRWQASRTDDFKHLPPEMDLWYTEYNLFDRAAPVHGTWMHGLFAATMSLLYLEESRVKLACLHALVGNAVFAAVFSTEKGFRLAGFTSPPDAPKTVPFALTAAGTSLSLLTETMRGQTTVQQISFSPAATIGVASGAYPALIGWSFTNERGARRAVLLNLSGQPHTVAIAAVAKRGGRCEQVSGDPLKLVTGPASLTRTEGAAQQKLVLPAYSVTRLY